MSALYLIGQPQSRRVTLFQQALANRRLAPAIVLSYADLIKNPVPLQELIPAGSLLRIDSPGDDFEVEKLLLELGSEAAEAEGSPFISRHILRGLPFDRGLMLFPRQWYLGFCRLLNRWDQQIEQIPTVQCLSSPREIQLLFDKRQCHEYCRDGGVPVPRGWGAIGDYDQFLQRARDLGSNHAFIKLAHGSSAAGVVAWRRQGDRQVAITSAELVREKSELRIYHSLKIRRYTETREIAALVDTLARECVHVEDWFPKASLVRETCFDLRIVTIAGEPKHMVVRQSSSPMTNLHLGNERGDLNRLLEKLGSFQLSRLHETCRRTAALFGNSLMLGLDIALSPRLNRHVLLEANAFGDLLPGLLYQGLDTYSAQIDFFQHLIEDRPGN